MSFQTRSSWTIRISNSQVAVHAKWSLGRWSLALGYPELGFRQQLIYPQFTVVMCC
jgi:hypothetical protein